VADEEWHPQQRGHHEPDGSRVLEPPYSDERELVMDVPRYGEGVEVLAPRSLREIVAAALARAATVSRC